MVYPVVRTYVCVFNIPFFICVSMVAFLKKANLKLHVQYRGRQHNIFLNFHSLFKSGTMYTLCESIFINLQYKKASSSENVPFYMQKIIKELIHIQI